VIYSHLLSVPEWLPYKQTSNHVKKQIDRQGKPISDMQRPCLSSKTFKFYPSLDMIY